MMRGGGTEHQTPPTLSQTIKNIIKPSWIFRKMVMIYADRKLFMLASLHIVMSAVVFAHFAMKKFHSQTEKVPGQAPFYNWKVGIPTFEFGTMHAILFQLAVLPLTMCRYLIANLWNTSLGKIIPFNDITKCHIAIGYTFMFLLFGTVVVFLMFFGVLCNSGDQAFCAKFRTEIIVTGYIIFILFMAVAVTSFLRFRIKYRIFYFVHHIIFAAYFLTLMHTIDDVHRKQGGRSQAFKWFSASLLLYASDRAAMYLNNRYFSTIVSGHAIDSYSAEEKMVIVKAKRPNLFFFHPGQYVYLKVPQLDNFWHPFSIGSAPESDTLDFYVKVSPDEKSWSAKLFVLMEGEQRGLTDFKIWEDDPHPNENLKIEILGPYGVGLGEKMKHSRALLVGSGTGFVPCLSFLREHVNQCVTVNKKGRDRNSTTSNAVIDGLSRQRSTHKLNMVNVSTDRPAELDQSIHLQMTEMMKIVENAKITKRQIVANTIALMGPALGVLMLGLTLSWNQLPFDLYDGMETVLIAGTILFQCCFLLLSSSKLWIGRNGFQNIWMYVDFIVIAISVVANWYFFYKDIWGGKMQDAQLVYYSLLAFYMIFRFIVHATESTDNSVEEMNKRKVGLVLLDKMKFVWISRSASSIAQVYPDIASVWDELVDAWGLSSARKSCEIVIHCTDRDKEACQDLVDGVQLTNLFKEGAIRFGRPSIEGLLDKNMAEVIEYSAEHNGVATSTLFAFCGSERLGKVAKEAKIFNDMFLSMTGNTQHAVDLFIQSYGGLVKNEQREDSRSQAEYFDIVPNAANSLDAKALLSRRSAFSLSSRKRVGSDTSTKSGGYLGSGSKNDDDLNSGADVDVIGEKGPSTSGGGSPPTSVFFEDELSSIEQSKGIFGTNITEGKSTDEGSSKKKYFPFNWT